MTSYVTINILKCDKCEQTIAERGAIVEGLECPFCGPRDTGGKMMRYGTRRVKESEARAPKGQGYIEE
jgi:hypothetical protein